VGSPARGRPRRNHRHDPGLQRRPGIASARVDRAPRGLGGRGRCGSVVASLATDATYAAQGGPRWPCRGVGADGWRGSAGGWRWQVVGGSWLGEGLMGAGPTYVGPCRVGAIRGCEVSGRSG
jgi:hypothetical protein